MSPGISLGVHSWRGIGRDEQPDLFVWRYRFGVVTLSVEREDLFEAYVLVKVAIVRTIKRLREEGR